MDPVGAKARLQTSSVLFRFWNRACTLQSMTLAEMEKRLILSTLKTTKDDVLLAAEKLGIGKTTVYRKLKEYERRKGRKMRLSN
jgi:transcriptional regulator with PAS, ATPase and Fis domain